MGVNLTLESSSPPEGETDKRLPDNKKIVDLGYNQNVSLDDRDLSLGKKIKDSELVGIPWTVIIGKNYEQNNQYEIINRSTGEKLFLSDNEVENFSFEQYTP